MITSQCGFDNLKITRLIFPPKIFVFYLHKYLEEGRRKMESMIITFVKDHKLFVQFDKLVNNGMLTITDNKQFLKHRKINNSEFEIIDLPDELPVSVNIQIDIDNKRIFKSIKIKNHNK